MYIFLEIILLDVTFIMIVLFWMWFFLVLVLV